MRSPWGGGPPNRPAPLDAAHAIPFGSSVSEQGDGGVAMGDAICWGDVVDGGVEPLGVVVVNEGSDHASGLVGGGGVKGRMPEWRSR